MNIVVFGAAGWLGRAVLSNLAGRHDVRAFDLAPSAWKAWSDIDGPYEGGEVIHGDITDFETVHASTDGADAVIHLAAYFPRGDDERIDEDAPRAFSINVNGLWNVLESARQRKIRRVAHVGSCQTAHPAGVFFTAEVRRPDATLYAVTKRLQEEMCRQCHEGHGMSIVVLRPDYIVDSRLGIARFREKLGEGGSTYRIGWVCRHDLAEACRLAAESTTIDFDIFHIVGTGGAEETCNVARSREVLELVYRGNLEQYR